MMIYFFFPTIMYIYWVPVLGLVLDLLAGGTDHLTGGTGHLTGGGVMADHQAHHIGMGLVLHFLL